MYVLVDYLDFALNLNLSLNLHLVLRGTKLAILVFNAVLVKLHFVQSRMKSLQKFLLVWMRRRQMHDI